MFGTRIVTPAEFVIGELDRGTLDPAVLVCLTGFAKTQERVPHERIQPQRFDVAFDRFT